MKILFTIIFGQFLAMISVGIGKTSTIIEDNFSFDFPILLNLSYYFLFGLFWLCVNRGLKKPKVFFFLIILFDTQANICKIQAFSKGELNYPIIINGSAVLFSLLFTYMLISKYTYRCYHILAAFITFSGVTLTLYGALNQTNTDIIEEIKKNKVDLIFALLSSILFSISTVKIDDCFDKGSDIYDFFPWLGLCGAFLIFIESFAFQEPQKFYNKINQFDINVKFVLLVFGFLVLFFIFGYATPFYIRRATNSMFNVSLVSQILWMYVVDCILGKAIAFKNEFYYIGCAVILGGIVLFGCFDVVKVKKEEIKEDVKKIKGGILPEEGDDESETGSYLGEGEFGKSVERKHGIYKSRQGYDMI